MRVGVFGGTFDPVHNGHLAAARTAATAAHLDEIVFVPVGVPGHRTAPIASGVQRLAMLEAALAEGAQADVRYSVSTIDIDRGEPTYTVNTLRDLHASRREDELFFILGSDAFAELGAWREPHVICELATLVVIGRQPQSRPLRPEPESHELAPRVIRVDLSGYDISATDIRQRVARGESLHELVPAAVSDFISANGLYAA